METSLTPEIAEQLSPETAQALDRILDRFGDVARLVDQLANAIGALNELDDQRAEAIGELQLVVSLLAKAQGIETKGEKLVEAIRAYTPPATDSRRVPNDLRAMPDEELLDAIGVAR